MKRFIAYDRLIFSISLLLIFICGSNNTFLLAQKKCEPGIQTTQVAKNFYKLDVNDIVNILVFNGPDGALLVDTGCEYVDLIEAELKKIGVYKIKFIINTHSHGDHVDGNAILGKEAVIISSHQCRKVLLKKDTFPKSGLPILTFSDSMSINFNDEEINLYFMPGHSDNDIVVHFTKANIVCIGDFGFFKPYFCWPGISGNVYNIEKSLVLMTNLFSDKTLIIHGHTNDYTMADLKQNVEMVQEAIMLVSPLIQKGLNLDQITQLNPLKNSTFSLVREYSEKWIWNMVRDKRHSNIK